MTTTAAKAFVDTGVLLRAIHTTIPLHREADALIKRVQKQGYELWISRQVIREYLVQVTRPQAYQDLVPLDEVLAHLRTMQSLFQVADDTAEVTAQLVALLQAFPTGGKQVHDANIVATMLAYRIDTLLTANVEDMKRFEDRITIIPLEPADSGTSS